MRISLLIMNSLIWIVPCNAFAQSSFGAPGERSIDNAERALLEINRELSAKEGFEFKNIKEIGRELIVIDRNSSGSLPARIAISEIALIDSGFQPPSTRTGRDRIVGGTLAELGEFPWAVSLGLAGYPAGAGHFCGGSLINEKWILTAAHCVEDTAPSSIKMLAGTTDLKSGGQIREVEQIIIHSDWDDRTNENDIALIKASIPFKFGKSTIRSVKYAASQNAHETYAPDGGILKVAGWGYIKEGAGRTERLLRKVKVPVVQRTACNDSYGGGIEDGMFCAGIGGKDSCQGDSGGPITATSEESIQMGVVSWGYGCARANYPGVYTKVADYANWIEDNIAD